MVVFTGRGEAIGDALFSVFPSEHVDKTLPHFTVGEFPLIFRSLGLGRERFLLNLFMGFLISAFNKAIR